MNTAPLQNTAAKSPPVSNLSRPGLLLQRKCACGGSAPPSSLTGECEECSKTRLQTKLSIGDSNGPLEQEADKIADQVLATQPFATMIAEPPRIQRFSGQSNEGVAFAPPSVEQVLASSGRPLEPSVKQDMEARFGYDFSQVRVHTGDAAAESARSIGAKAYTLGNNVVFGSGEYQSGTFQGRHLIAHELTHTLQQGMTSGTIRRSCGAEAIGTPEGCTSNSTVVPERPRYLFNVNCDDFLTGNELDLRKDAETIKNGEEVELHGLASEEGSAVFNNNLSCARVLKAKTVIEDVLKTRGVSATIKTYSHGAQPGEKPINRSVALIRKTTPEPDPKIKPKPDKTPDKDPYYKPVPGENVCDDATFCTPFTTTAEIASAKSYLLTSFIPVLEGLFGADVGALWRAYLARKRGDSLAPRLFDTPGNSIYEAFSTNNFIHDEVDKVLSLIAGRLSRGYGNVTQPLDNFVDPPEKILSTDFANPFTIPGNIAGGIGSSDAGVDERRITWGTASFDITPLPFGKKLVTIEAFVNFMVKDAIDFCPGQCGSIAEQQLATLMMSRLEASGEAYDVPFIVRFPGPTKTKKVIA